MKLDLSDNNIEDIGVQHIADSLKENKVSNFSS